MVGTEWWRYRIDGGNTVSRIQFYEDSAVTHDYTFSPRKQVSSRGSVIESLQVTRDAHIVGTVLSTDRVYTYYETDWAESLEVYVTLFQWKRKWKDAWVYDYSTYNEWGAIRYDSDSLYYGYIEEYSGELMWMKMSKKKPLNLIF